MDIQIFEIFGIFMSQTFSFRSIFFFIHWLRVEDGARRFLTWRSSPERVLGIVKCNLQTVDNKQLDPST